MCLLLVATLGTAAPAARAGERDDLKDRQDQVQAQIEQTQEDAEEASKAVNQAKADLASAEAQLVNAQSAYAGAQAHVADVQAKLQAAQAKDAEMQAALAVAQANLEKARADVVAGQAALDAQQAQVKDTVVEVYQQGSPALMAWTGYLQSQTPADLIRKLEYADTLIEDQNTVFDQLHAAEVALREERARVRDAEDAAEIGRASCRERV